MTGQAKIRSNQPAAEVEDQSSSMVRVSLRRQSSLTGISTRKAQSVSVSAWRGLNPDIR